MRIALGVEYDGSAFCGWQSQATRCGVQDALQNALSNVAAAQVKVTAAGRTDTGVHALEQVVHFDCDAVRPLSAWTRGVNALLPSAIACRWAHPVGDDFDARRSALTRSYQYVLAVSPVRPALHHARVGWFHRPLDVRAMSEAALALVGEHDFSAFRASQCQARSPVRNVTRLDIAAVGERVYFDVEANAFLHHMVRNIVGALVYVGAGREPVGWMQTLLNSRDRTRGAPTFDPAGLYLKSVKYDVKWQLPSGAHSPF